MFRGMFRFRRRWRLLAASGLLFLASLSIYRRTGTTNKKDEDEDKDVVLMLRKTKNQKEYIDRKGIHVIVGHYIGNEMPWEKSNNFSQEFLNHNGFSPIPLAGELGQPVQVGPHEKERMRALFQLNRFNLLASDRIALNRSLMDVRKPVCRNQTYNDAGLLPSTSVIIVFHNEAWSTLLRTVHSVINRSPRHLLQEIILVDDASTRKFLHEELEQHVSRLSVPVNILRSVNRTGLIRARLMGAKVAKGQVLTFLDAHCECAKGWLEPLLYRIAQERTRVVCPVIDIIHDETFGYAKSFEMHWGAFNWELHFRWFPLGRQEMKNRKGDNTWPFRTPVMAGGLFAIDKLYFEEMGTYDDQMDIWGGENIELSFRIWQCGGSLEIVPCSHVGHVFRRSSPYKFPGAGGVGAILYKNLARVAEVWMDEWREFYFAMNYEAAKLRPALDVSKRKALRRKLKCRSFKWYLDHIWPQHFFPTDTRIFGKIRNMKNDQCMNRPQSKTGSQQAVGRLLTKECVIEIYPQQCFLYLGDGYIMTDESVCLDAPDSSPGTAVITLACNEMQRQKWKYDPLNMSIKHTLSGLCMDLRVSQVAKEDGTTFVQLEECNGKKSQQWQMEAVEWNPRKNT